MAKSAFSRPPKTCIETKQLAIALLGKNGMLEPGHRETAVSWPNLGGTTTTVWVEAIIDPEQSSYLLLSYTLASGKTQDYRVELARVASNLPGSKACRYYMLCPVTGRRASVLYLREGTALFVHREAYPETRLYYDSQLEQKRYRGLTKQYYAQKAWQREALPKYRKTIYAGKETKWFAALQKKLSRAHLLTNTAAARLAARY